MPCAVCHDVDVGPAVIELLCVGHLSRSMEPLLDFICVRGLQISHDSVACKCVWTDIIIQGKHKIDNMIFFDISQNTK